MAKIKNFNYSFQRHNSKQEMEEELKHDNELRKKLKDLYEKSMDSVQSDIDRELSFLSSKENVSLADALQRINKFDVERFSRIAKRWVKEKNKTEMDNKWMRRYNVTMRTNRLELLNAYIGIAMEQLANEEEQITTEYLEHKASRVFAHQAGILGNSVPEVSYLSRASQIIVKGGFNKTNFSERIWSNSAEMHEDLMNVLRKVLIQGKHPIDASKDLRKHVKASFIGDGKTKGRNAKYVAERLAVTEATFLQTEIQRLNFLEYGVEDYEYKVEQRPCPVCSGLSGKIFKVTDMVAGVNAPPMHPWCKCSLAPLTERLKNTKKSGDGENKNKKSPLDLQMFARKSNDKEAVEQLIKKGVIDKDYFKQQQAIFNQIFSKGVDTPIETVYNDDRSYYHIIRGHHKDLLKENAINQIVNTLTNPTDIYRSVDKNGIKANSYYSDKSKLLVVVRKLLVTAYYPSKEYFEKLEQRSEKIKW